MARPKGRVSLRRNLWKLANNGNVAACIFLAKNLLGYRDVVNTRTHRFVWRADSTGCQARSIATKR